MENPLYQHIFYFICFIFLLICAILAFLLLERSEKIKRLESSVKRLRLSFNELDEQTKMIIKTDLELNTVQEELDKRLNGLDALHKISRLISTTLDENEIFQCLNQPILSELGFEKYLIFTPDADQKLKCRVSFGYSMEEIASIIKQCGSSGLDLKLLKTSQTISSVKKDTLKESSKYLKTFNVNHFIITPILAQKEFIGIIVAGNQSDAYAFTEGDVELISILADQIGQTVKNARYFEEVYRSQQNLELTVQERTKQLSSALEEVKIISKKKSEFISSVSHELRTPLTSIKGYASILITGKVGQIPEAVKERLAKINKHSDNLVKMINDLLDIARIESGRREMHFEKSSIAPIISNIQDLLTPQLKEKNIEFKATVPEPLPEIMMDKNQVERIFINLVGNALKFTPEKGKITITAEQNEQLITFSVTDTGVGIKESEIGKLFNEFYRVENEINQTVKGTGLGLSLVKKIVEAHQGKIWVSSKINKGTTFNFTLPIDHT